MSDELDSFFAKKQQKKKRTGVQNVDVLARKLEKTVRQQEELEKIEDETLQKETEPKQLQQIHNEDPEWYEFQQDDEVDFGALNIKQMEMTEHDVGDDSEDDQRIEQKKTWKLINQDSEKVVEPDPESQQAPVVEAAPVVAQKYVPPSLRGGGGSGRGAASANINLENAEEFPSLADAIKIETEKEKDQKKKTNKPVSRPSGNEAEGDRQTPTEDFTPVHVPAKNAYIPPSRRRMMEQGGGGMETQNRYTRLANE